MALAGWRALRTEPGLDTILAVDFTQVRGRGKATFGDLATHLPGGLTVQAPDETCWPGRSADPRRHLAEWVARAGEAAGEVLAVLGFCAGTWPAAALAARIADVRGRAPALVLFDPMPAGPHTLLHQFETSLQSIASAAAPEELDRARHEARADVDAGLDPAALVDRLAARYEALARPVCAAQRIPLSVADQLCLRAATGLGYLAVCAAAAEGPGSPDAELVVLSRHHQAPPGIHPARQVRLDVAAEELLATPAAAAAVTEVLTATGVARP